MVDGMYELERLRVKYRAAVRAIEALEELLQVTTNASFHERVRDMLDYLRRARDMLEREAARKMVELEYRQKALQYLDGDRSRG